MRNAFRHLSFAILLLGASISVSCSGEGRAAKDTAKARNAAPAIDEHFAKPGPAPKLRLPDVVGTERALEDFSGKLVLLNFWATWCAPCVAEMPSLERLYKRFKDRGLEVVAVSVDTDRKGVAKFVEKNGLSFPILIDVTMSSPPKYGVTGFPESFFISPRGELLAVKDPESAEEKLRLIADRAWDSQNYTSLVEELLTRELP